MKSEDTFRLLTAVGFILLLGILWVIFDVLLPHFLRGLR